MANNEGDGEDGDDDRSPKWKSFSVRRVVKVRADLLY